MFEEGVENAQVGVAQGSGLVGEVEEVAYHDVDKDAEVVGIEVFIGCRGGEEQVEQFQDQEL